MLKNSKFLEPLSSALMRDRDIIFRVFCKKFNFEQLLFKTFSNKNQYFLLQSPKQFIFPLKYIIIQNSSYLLSIVVWLLLSPPDGVLSGALPITDRPN